MRRLIGWVGRFATALLLRRIEVADRARFPTGRPVLVVANHFNGFVDPLVIATALGRLPRFVAKDGLSRMPLAGFLLRRAGVVFVRRRVDHDGDVVNDDAFHECHQALVERDTVAIFPEGTTHDRPRLDPIKTGAARIALGARAAGAADLIILPVGLTYPDKVALRPAALVQLGVPLELDDLIPAGIGADDQEAVRRLTDAIDGGLRGVSLDFPDIETSLALEQAAHVALSDADDPDPSLAERYALAGRLGRAPADHQAAVRREIGRYSTVLAGLRLTDADIIHPTSPSRLLRSVIGLAVLVAILGGLVAATAIVNLWPAALVALVSLLVKAPVSKGTARAVVGLVTFPTAWIAAGVIRADGFLPVTLVALTAAAGALAAVWLVDRAMALTHMLLRWQAQRERIGTVAWAEAVRADVVGAVRTAAAVEAT